MPQDANIDLPSPSSSSASHTSPAPPLPLARAWPPWYKGVPATERRPLLLHITADYPDPVRPDRPQATLAIKRLIDGLTEFDHVIFSLKRFADPRKTYMVECPPPAANQRLFAFGHFGLPWGIGLRAAFTGAARHIESILEAERLAPDLIHSHKLAYDGIAGNLISRRRKLPHIVSVRGEADSKVIRVKPNYHPLLARIASEADVVLYVSAWIRPTIERIAPLAIETGRPFPNIVANVRARITPQPPIARFVVACRLDTWRQKGLDRLIRAMARVRSELGPVGLDIYGAGSPEATAYLKQLVARHGLSNLVEFKGRVPNEEFLARLPRYLALVLPARNETFGMVYTEALFAGVPILYGRNNGIDGFLDGLMVGVGVSPNSIAEIAAALVALSANRDAFRAGVAAAGPELDRRFNPAQHLATYQADVLRLVAPD